MCYDAGMSEAKRRKPAADELPQVYVTKYALIDVIRRCALDEVSDRYAWVRWPGGLNGVIMVSRKDIHETIDTAQTRSKELALKRLRALDKQRATLEKIAKDGARIVEDKR